MVLRLGILGGSFDPVHEGHLRLARWARAELRLDRVLLVPTFRQPLKGPARSASAVDRLAMVYRAVRGFEGSLGVSSVEARRGGVSYTLDTLRALEEEHRGRAALFFLAGADSLQSLPLWRGWREILARARFCVARRPGVRDTVPAAIEGALRERICGFPMPLWRWSSSEVRRRLAAGEDAQGLVPAGVREYIEAHGLYRRPGRRRRAGR